VPNPRVLRRRTDPAGVTLFRCLEAFTMTTAQLRDARMDVVAKTGDLSGFLRVQAWKIGVFQKRTLL
jgi:hypothetical protein